eukprot:scaffold10191_cov108-Isochrysis_galbana.AAC.14
MKGFVEGCKGTHQLTQPTEGAATADTPTRQSQAAVKVDECLPAPRTSQCQYLVDNVRLVPQPQPLHCLRRLPPFILCLDLRKHFRLEHHLLRMQERIKVFLGQMLRQRLLGERRRLTALHRACDAATLAERLDRVCMRGVRHVPPEASPTHEMRSVIRRTLEAFAHSVAFKTNDAIPPAAPAQELVALSR